MSNTSWATIASLLLDIVQDSTPEGKAVAREEIIKIGEKLDKVNALPTMEIHMKSNIMDKTVEVCSEGEAESLVTVRIISEKVIA